jgi:hypothetical protein
VDFASYATFGTDLVSSEPDEMDPADPLTSLDGLRAFLRTRPWIAERVTDSDLPPLVALRAELRRVFESARQGRDADMDVAAHRQRQQSRA